MSQPAKEQSAKQAVMPQSLVTEEHVKAALRVDKGSDAILRSWSVVDFTKLGDNYVCAVSSVEVKYSLSQENMEVVYIVKLNSCRPMKEMEFMTSISFHKESEFYLTLVPELNSVLKAVGHKGLRLPQCFHSCLDKDKEIIFLEDLRPRGFQMFDRKRGLDVAHTTLIVEELGRLHAASCLLQAKTPDEDLAVRHNFLVADACTDERTGLLEVIRSQVNQSISLLDKTGGYERSIAWIQSLKPNLLKILKKDLGRGKYNVVCHGDCWNNNVLFRYNDDGEPAEVMLLDLQMNRFTSPTFDLNYLVYTSMNGDVRRHNLDTFLDSYYDIFTTIMEAAGMDMIFTRSELLQEFRDKNVIGSIFAIFILSFILTEPEDTPDLNVEDVDTFLKDLREKAMKTIDKNPLTKPRFLAVFDEMTELGVIP